MKSLVVCIMAFGAVLTLMAQDRPHVGFVYPAGAMQGTNVTVVIGGQFLENITNVYITGQHVSGVKVNFTRDIDPFALGQLYNSKNVLEGTLNIFRTITTNRSGTNVSYITNVTTNDAYNIRSETKTNIIETNGIIETNFTVTLISNLMGTNQRAQLIRQLERTEQLISYSMRPPDDRDMMMYMRDIQRKKQPNAQLTDRVHVSITVDPEAVVGKREIRLATARGFSEPIVFYIGNIPEVYEREPNQLARPNSVDSLPAVFNGQVMPGETDCFKFSARKGQNLVFVVQARSLIPYLADAVPGWFQSVITLYTAAGKEVAYEDDYLGSPDPVMSYTVPEDGDYVIEIRDSIYRGREDFVFRILAGEMPFAAMSYPLGGPAYGTTKVELKGVNIANADSFIEPRMYEPGIVTVPPPEGGVPIPTLFFADNMPEVFEKEGNNSAVVAQQIRLPSVINGRIDPPGDIDSYVFTGREGERIIAEVYARRLNSPLDSALRLADSKGAVLQTNDDYVDKTMGMVTHHADSYINFILPRNGAYTLTLRDVQGKGGDFHAYRLRVSPPRPDFKLRVSPSAISIPRGGIMPLSLFVQRIDGFTNDIVLSLDDAPNGYTLSGGTLRGTSDTLPVTLNAAYDVPTNTMPLKIIGTSVYDGLPVKRTALPCEDMMQAFFFRHLIVSDDFIVLTLPDRARTQLSIDIGSNNIAAQISANKETMLPIKYPPVARGQRVAYTPIELALDNPPKGFLTIRTTPISPTNDTYVVVKTDASVKPGQRGNLIFVAYTPWERRGTNGVLLSSGRTFYCNLPAIAYEVR
ncbi:MAG: hypothetical protein AABZ39_16590 [Spirochaetota bacterium]